MVTTTRQTQRPNNATPPQSWCAPNTGLSVTWVESRHGHDIARLQLQAHPLRLFAQRAKCCMCKSWGASAGSKGARTIVVWSQKGHSKAESWCVQGKFARHSFLKVPPRQLEGVTRNRQNRQLRRHEQAFTPATPHCWRNKTCCVTCLTGRCCRFTCRPRCQ